jgi:hypothetical protein
MTVQVLSTSNTFLQWVTETQKMLFVVNQFTDGVLDSTNYSNTNIDIGNDLNVGGDLTVRGLLVLDDTDYNDLNVSGNVTVVGTVDSDLAVFSNLNILNNVFSVNTTTLNVGTDANLNTLSVFDTFTTSSIEITGDITGTSNLFVPNLTVTENVETLNVSSELFVGTEATLNTLSVFDTLTTTIFEITGDITGTPNLSTENLVVTENVETFNVSSGLFVGTEATLNTLSVFDTFIISNIEITGDITGTPNLSVPNLFITENVETFNVSSELFIGSDAVISGNLLSFLCCESGLNLTGDLSLDLAFIDTATVTTLIGTANTNIYNNIFASNAYTSVQNTLAEFASLSCILG